MFGIVLKSGAKRQKNNVGQFKTIEFHTQQILAISTLQRTK